MTDRVSDIMELLSANRLELIQNGTCAYMSPRPNGLYVSWMTVERELLTLRQASAEPIGEVCQNGVNMFVDAPVGTTLYAHPTAQPAHIPTDAEAIEAEQLSEASAEPVALPYVVEYARKDGLQGWTPMAAFDQQTVAEQYAQDCGGEIRPWKYRVVNNSPAAQPAPTDGPTPEQIEYMAGDYLSAAMTDKVHLGVLQEVMEGPSPPQPAPAYKCPIHGDQWCSCPTPKPEVVKPLVCDGSRQIIEPNPLSNAQPAPSTTGVVHHTHPLNLQPAPAVELSLCVHGKILSHCGTPAVPADVVLVSRSLAQRTTAMFVSVDPAGSIAEEWRNVLAAAQEKSR